MIPERHKKVKQPARQGRRGTITEIQEGVSLKGFAGLQGMSPYIDETVGDFNDPYLSGILAAQTIDAVRSQAVPTNLKVSDYNSRYSQRSNGGP